MKHPAKFSDGILAVIRPMLPQSGTVLDPFAGSGKVHELATPTLRTFGIEIEPEWAALHPRTYLGDALDLPYLDGSFDAIVTSPTYGNRMADHHEAKDASRRITYRHTLGRPLHPNNSGQLQWGRAYREFHTNAWFEACRVLKPGGRFILNVSDHVRKGAVIPVSDWHVETLHAMGLLLVERHEVPTARMRFGKNGAARVENEWVILMVKP